MDGAQSQGVGWCMVAEIILGEDTRIGRNVELNVDYLELGDRCTVNDNAIIEGNNIIIGHEAWIDRYAHIGGGSCRDEQSTLTVGDFLHMGKFSHINAAREIVIGDECGVGIGTKIFTHGAYLSQYDGFPVSFKPNRIGSRVWLPHAWVNPGVSIGDDVVVAAMSLVNRDLASGCLYGGIPVKLLRENVYPRVLSEQERTAMVRQTARDVGLTVDYCDGVARLDETVFTIPDRVIEGEATERTELLKNQFRRRGVRFKYKVENGEYQPW